MTGVDFIQDLGVVTLLAAAAAWLCQRLHLPVVIGYLTVGTVLFPNDTLLLVGRDADLRDAEQRLNTTENGQVAKAEESVLGALGLLPLFVPLVTRHAGKPLSELDPRTHWGVQVVAIKRAGEAVVSPGRSETLQPGDRLLVLGTPEQVNDFAFWLST